MRGNLYYLYRVMTPPTENTGAPCAGVGSSLQPIRMTAATEFIGGVRAEEQKAIGAEQCSDPSLGQVGISDYLTCIRNGEH